MVYLKFFRMPVRMQIFLKNCLNIFSLLPIILTKRFYQKTIFLEIGFRLEQKSGIQGQIVWLVVLHMLQDKVLMKLIHGLQKHMEAMGYLLISFILQ